MKISIKQQLEDKHMTRYELAKRIGVTYPTITSIYNGESTSIKLDILESICKELNCTPNDILIYNQFSIIYMSNICILLLIITILRKKL